jgi:hypothetical protein
MKAIVISILEWDNVPDDTDLKKEFGLEGYKDLEVKHLKERDNDYGGNGRAVQMSSETMSQQELFDLAVTMPGWNAFDNLRRSAF